MVEDSNISTKVSPFAVRQGEIKTFDGKDGYVSMDQVVQKVNSGVIVDIHFKILELVNEFEFLTTRQINQLLALKNMPAKSEDALKGKLDQLIKNKLLTRYYFLSETGHTVYRIYCLEKLGKYLLQSKEIECKWQQSDNIKPISMIKKRLAGNQILIAYMTKVKAYNGYKVKPAIKAKMLGKTFKASGGEVTLTKNKKSIQFIFEVIRREESWEEKLITRMNLYKDFYQNFVEGDSGFNSMPQLILICEDEKHMAEVFREIVVKGAQIDQIKLYFSTDLKQTEESLSKTLIQFVLDEDTNKYKAQNIELNLLS